MVSRRQFLAASVPAAVSAAMMPHLLLAEHARGGGGASSGGSGFFPLAQSMQPLGINMRQVFPRPDSETNTYAAHHYAFWDSNASVGLQYRRRVGVSFGRWPYTYQLMSGPPGMYIGASIWNPAWNNGGQAAAQDGYGTVYWMPTAGNVSSGPWVVWVRIYDQNYQNGQPAGSWIDVQWTLWVAGYYVNQAITFTGSLSSGATSATLSSAWTGYTGGVSFAFSDGETRICNVTNGSTAISWSTGLTSNVTASAKATGGHIVLDSTNGNDTNTGTLAAPLKTIVGAYGASYATSGSISAFPQAIAILRGSPTTTVEYVPPAYTDNPSSSGQPIFSWNPTTKPCALLVYPGESATIDLTASQTGGNLPALGSAYTTSHCGDDAFYQDFAFNGFDGSQSNPRGFYYASNRVTFDNITWNNSGTGSSSASNATLIFLDASSTSPSKYCFINGCQDQGRAGGTSGNNYGLASCYDGTDVLWEFNYLNAPSSSMDNAYYFKEGVQYGCIRANLANISSTTNIFATGQGYIPHLGAGCEYCFNTVIGTSKQKFSFGSAAFTWGNQAVYRSSYTNGVIQSAQSTYNLMGPTIDTPSVAAGSSSFGAGTQYWTATSVGATGESVIGNGFEANRVSATLAAGDVVTLTIQLPEDEAGNALSSATNIYRSATSGSEEFLVQLASGVTTYTDTGSSTTTQTAPTTNTAISAARTVINSNALQGASAGFPTGTLFTNDGNNQVVTTSGLLDPSTGKLLGSYRTSYLNLVGAEVGATS